MKVKKEWRKVDGGITYYVGWNEEVYGAEKVIELFTELSNNPTNDEYTFGVLDGIKDTLTLLGIKIEGVNA